MLGFCEDTYVLSQNPARITAFSAETERPIPSVRHLSDESLADLARTHSRLAANAQVERQVALERRRVKRILNRRLIDKADRLGVLAALPQRERLVIEMRFGLREAHATIASTAARLDMSYERVRQIENATLKLVARLCAQWSWQEVGVGLARCPPDPDPRAMGGRSMVEESMDYEPIAAVAGPDFPDEEWPDGCGPMGY